MKISLMHSQVLQHQQQLLSAFTCALPAQKRQAARDGGVMNSTQELILPKGD